jgi:beta-galactosidase
MGLGGDDSWTPRTHPEYLLTEKEYTYSFRLRPFDATAPLAVITQTVLPEITAQSQAASELGAPASVVKEGTQGGASQTNEDQEAAIKKAEARKFVKKKPTRRKSSKKKRRR